MRKTNFVSTALIIIGFLLFSRGMALAASQTMKVLQPRYNFEFEVYRTADMPANWFKTHDGYYVTRDLGGDWVYGRPDGNSVTLTDIMVGRDEKL